MRVASITGSVSRDAGGLFESVRALNAATAQFPDIDVRVYGSVDSHTQQDIPDWGELPVAAFKTLGPRQFGFSPGLLQALRRWDPDLLHVHGIWMYASVAAVRWKRKTGGRYIVSAHGMLDNWALRNSYWKKKLAMAVYEMAHLRGAKCIRALCQAEAQAIRDLGLENPIALVPNGVGLPDLSIEYPPPRWAGRIPPGGKVLFFLSRIHPKKGLSELLGGFARASRACPEARTWHLVIAGWSQGEHQIELEKLTRQLGLENTVHFVGPQFGADKAASMTRADAFILPSFSEGLPMAVLEAWSYRRPVIMTDECNLPSGFRCGAASRIRPDAQDIARGLVELFSTDATILEGMGDRGRKLVESDFSWPRVGADMVAVYRWMVDGGPAPTVIQDAAATTPR